jgi:hypothetical protein
LIDHTVDPPLVEPIEAVKDCVSGARIEGVRARNTASSVLIRESASVGKD